MMRVFHQKIQPFWLPTILISLTGAFLPTFFVNGSNHTNNNVSSAVIEASPLIMNKWEPNEELKKAFPLYLSGYDKEGHPVFVLQSGKWDIRGYLESGQKDVGRDFELYMDQIVNVITSPELISPRIEGDPAPQKFVIISDMDGYSIRQVAHGLTIQKYLYAMRKFVEALRKKNRNIRKGFFVNSNFVFQTVWNLMKPIFGETISFMELHGSKSSRWKPVLLEYIDRDQLPAYLGGTKDHTPIKVYG